MKSSLSLSLPWLQRISTARKSAALFASILGAAFGFVPQPASAQNGAGGHSGHPITPTSHASPPPVWHPVIAPQARIATPPVPTNAVRPAFPPHVIATPPVPTNGVRPAFPPHVITPPPVLANGARHGF